MVHKRTVRRVGDEKIQYDPRHEKFKVSRHDRTGGVIRSGGRNEPADHSECKRCLQQDGKVDPFLMYGSPNCKNDHDEKFRSKNFKSRMSIAQYFGSRLWDKGIL